MLKFWGQDKKALCVPFFDEAEYSAKLFSDPAD